MPCIKRNQFANANAFSDEEDFDQYDQNFDVDDNINFDSEDRFFGQEEDFLPTEKSVRTIGEVLTQQTLQSFHSSGRWADKMEDSESKVMVQFGQQTNISTPVQVESVKNILFNTPKTWNSVSKPVILTMDQLEVEAKEESTRAAKEIEFASIRKQKQQEKLRKENESRAAIQYAEQKNKKDAYYRKSYAQRERVEKPKNPQQTHREPVRHPVQAPVPKSVLSKNVFALLEEE